MRIFLFTFALLTVVIIKGQNGAAINSSGATADPSAGLDVQFSDKGILIPRLTEAERNAISSPALGLIIYNTSTECFNVFKTNGWFEICGECIKPATPAASANTPVCETGTLNLSATNITNASYLWSGPNGFTSNLQNPSINNITTSDAGVYSVTATVNGCTSNGGTITVSVNPLPLSTNSGTHIPTATQIVWKWTAVSGVTGYKWNTVNDYNTATDMGTNTSYTETGLTPSTSYTRYVWTYNTCGASGSLTLTQSTTDACNGVASVTYTGGPVGGAYTTVAIGNQCWMKQSLNANPQYCCTCSTYGGLYQWTTIMNGATSSNSVPSGVQGICPTGWHIPSNAEWTILVNTLGANGGTKLKAGGSSGFEALYSGNYYSGSCGSQGNQSCFWTSTETTGETTKASNFSTYYSDTYIGNSNNLKTIGYAVRCLKD